MTVYFVSDKGVKTKLGTFIRLGKAEWKFIKSVVKEAAICWIEV